MVWLVMVIVVVAVTQFEGRVDEDDGGKGIDDDYDDDEKRWRQICGIDGEGLFHS